MAEVLLAPMGFHRCAHPAFGSTVSRSMGTIPAFPAPQQPMFTLNSSISACFPEGLTRARGGDPEIRKRGFGVPAGWVTRLIRFDADKSACSPHSGFLQPHLATVHVCIDLLRATVSMGSLPRGPG